MNRGMDLTWKDEVVLVHGDIFDVYWLGLVKFASGLVIGRLGC